VDNLGQYYHINYPDCLWKFSKGETKMFIDYLTLIMINMVAGTVILAYYLWKGIDQTDQRPYASAFLGVGALAILLGLHMSTTWPLPGSYNIAFGEPTTLFGVVFLMAGISLSQGWDLIPVSIFAFFAGADGLLVGLRLLSLNMTKEPLLSAVGFVLAGLGGIFSAPFFMFFRNNKLFRMLAILVLLATAAIWAVTFYGSIWGHIESFAKWAPSTMPPAK
jgi:putative membrane protein